MQAILNANFHFNGGVEFRVSAQCMDHNVQLLGDVIESSDQRGPKKISARRGGEKNNRHFVSSSSHRVIKFSDACLDVSTGQTS